MAEESATTRLGRGRVRNQRARYRIAAWLAIAGALVWAVQALGALIQSQEGKWQGGSYLTIGGSSITAATVLTLSAFAFVVVSSLLGGGAVSLLRGWGFGRYVLLAGAWLVALGQLTAALLAWIPIDAFYHSPPANFVFYTPAVVFPVVTILCLIDIRESPVDVG
ncbi:hypothetical protein [Nocardia sp. NPDC057668]|uniref:hypothetical protein n=1 Tax=Nocardia sp. NPDC057668 TaxID=3346202 RepID=UPI0036706BC6